MISVRFNLRALGLLVVVHAVFAHCVIMIARSMSGQGHSFFSVNERWPSECGLAAFIGLGSYVLLSTFLSVDLLGQPHAVRGRCNPVVAASLVCVLLVSAWALVAYGFTGESASWVDGKWMNPTVIAGWQAVAIAVISAAVVSSIESVAIASQWCNPDNLAKSQASGLSRGRVLLVVFALWIPVLLAIIAFVGVAVHERRRIMLTPSLHSHRVFPRRSVQPADAKAPSNLHRNRELAQIPRTHAIGCC